MGLRWVGATVLAAALVGCTSTSVGSRSAGAPTTTALTASPPPTGPPPASPPPTGPSPTSATTSGVPSATAGTTATPPAAPPVLPDATFTPGATDPDVTQATVGTTICASGWTATVRPPESYTEEVKRLEAGAGGTVEYRGQTYTVHGFAPADPTLGHYELDHLIPLELGGAPADPRNLWLEPYETPDGSAAPGTGSQTKDRVENAGREAVCNSRLSLVDAQRAIAQNWYQFGQQLGAVPPD